MVNEYLDFSATHGIEVLFKLSSQRAAELIGQLKELEKEISENYKEYSHAGTEESPGDGLLPGKVMARLLEIAKSPSEELVVIYVFRTFLDSVLNAVDDIMFRERILANHPDANIIEL